MTFEDVNLDSDYQIAQRGKIVREFEPVGYGKPWTGTPSAYERHIRFGDEKDWHSMAKCMLLTYRLSGIAVTLDDVLSEKGLAVGVLVDARPSADLG